MPSTSKPLPLRPSTRPPPHRSYPTNADRASAHSLPTLPPELLDTITSYLPPSALHHLSLTSRDLARYTSLHGWRSLVATTFPTTRPATSQNWAQTARTLCTLARAWEQRAIVARGIEPRASVVAWTGTPGEAGKKGFKWRRPAGQTLGFVPIMDVREDEQFGGEVLAYSAGTQVLVRKRGRRSGGRGKVQWEVFAPEGRKEGRDDVTCLHLTGREEEGAGFVVGTAGGRLEGVRLPARGKEGVERKAFETGDRPVRSSSFVPSFSTGRNFLAAQLGESTICLYDFDGSEDKTIAPTSCIEIDTSTGGTNRNTSRIWSTKFLSDTHLALGTGPSTEPVRVYTLTSTGLEATHVRKLSFDTPSDRLETADTKRKPLNSVYPIIPLPATTTSTHPSLFLSGAYDGLIRLHDLRSDLDISAVYTDPTDDSGIYSLLARGHETFLAGANGGSRLKFFDLRMGTQRHSWLDDDHDPKGHSNTGTGTATSRDWTLFLRRPPIGKRREVRDSAIYSLASASPSSPHVYAGIEASVLELAVSETMDPNPDPLYFEPLDNEGKWNACEDKDVLSLVMYDHVLDGPQRIWHQSGLRVLGGGRAKKGGLDGRWRYARQERGW